MCKEQTEQKPDAVGVAVEPEVRTAFCGTENDAHHSAECIDTRKDALISHDDYKQVFEETCMSVIEGLVKQGKKADIHDTPIIIKRWVKYFWQQ